MKLTVLIPVFSLIHICGQAAQLDETQIKKALGLVQEKRTECSKDTHENNERFAKNFTAYEEKLRTAFPTLKLKVEKNTFAQVVNHYTNELSKILSMIKDMEKTLTDAANLSEAGLTEEMAKLRNVSKYCKAIYNYVGSYLNFLDGQPTTDDAKDDFLRDAQTIKKKQSISTIPESMKMFLSGR